MMPGSREISLQGDLGELGDIAKYRLPLFDQWVLIGSSDKGPQDVMPYETKARSGSCSGCCLGVTHASSLCENQRSSL